MHPMGKVPTLHIDPLASHPSSVPFHSHVNRAEVLTRYSKVASQLWSPMQNERKFAIFMVENSRSNQEIFFSCDCAAQVKTDRAEFCRRMLKNV